MTNDEVQKDLLAETKTPEQAFEYAIRREKGLENQLQIRKQGTSTSSSQQMGIKTEPVAIFQKRRDQNRNNRRGNRGRLQSQRDNIQRQGNDQKQSCYKCGNPFGPGHLQQCPAKDKICNKMHQMWTLQLFKCQCIYRRTRSGSTYTGNGHSSLLG